MADTLRTMLNQCCEAHGSGDIASDMIALFEDIKKFFENTCKECIDFDALSEEAQTELYEELVMLIQLFKSMKLAADKTAVIHAMSTRMVSIMSKRRKEYEALIELDKPTQQLLKQRFADMVLFDLYKKNQQDHAALQHHTRAAARHISPKHKHRGTNSNHTSHHINKVRLASIRGRHA
jgi:hypothetical protein